jgi:hypothetical protein
MGGVVHRSPEELGEPREVVVEGSPDVLAELMGEFAPEYQTAPQERTAP